MSSPPDNAREIKIYCGDPAWPLGPEERLTIPEAEKVRHIITAWKLTERKERSVFVLGPYAMGSAIPMIRVVKAIVDAICQRGLPTSLQDNITVELHSNFEVLGTGMGFGGCMTFSNVMAAFGNNGPMSKLTDWDKQMYLERMEKNLKEKTQRLFEGLIDMTKRLSSGDLEIIIKLFAGIGNVIGTGAKIASEAMGLAIGAAREAAKTAREAREELSGFLRKSPPKNSL